MCLIRALLKRKCFQSTASPLVLFCFFLFFVFVLFLFCLFCLCFVLFSPDLYVLDADIKNIFFFKFKIALIFVSVFCFSFWFNICFVCFCFYFVFYMTAARIFDGVTMNDLNDDIVVEIPLAFF